MDRPAREEVVDRPGVCRDVAERSGIDKAALSRLENGVHDNPTVETLMRYATAIGKRLTWKLEDLAPTE